MHLDVDDQEQPSKERIADPARNFVDRVADERRMPSQEHDGLVRLVELRPELAAELLALAGVVAPPHDAAALSTAQLTDLEPAEYRADAVVVLQGSGSTSNVLGIVVETQLGRDGEKRWVWPAYAVSLRRRLKCPTCVLVIAPDASVAADARSPIALGPGGSVFQAIVVGPSEVPIVTDEAEAIRSPEVALLSVVAHGHGPSAKEIARAALAGAGRLPDEQQRLYSELIYLAVGEATRRAVEELMTNGPYVYKSDFALKHQAKGRAEGLAAGRAEGRAEGRAVAVLDLLEARGIAVTAEDRARVLACTDEVTLGRWFHRAVTASSVDVVFAE